VEGAGGVCDPVNEQEYMIDIMKALRLPIILVTSPRLGTLNHTLLSLAMIEKYSGTLAGVIINNSANHTRDYIYLDNIAYIRNRCAGLPILETDFCTSITDEIRIFCDEL
jgi:dethiobiotin synthetase